MGMISKHIQGKKTSTDVEGKLIIVISALCVDLRARLVRVGLTFSSLDANCACPR